MLFKINEVKPLEYPCDIKHLKCPVCHGIYHSEKNTNPGHYLCPKCGVPLSVLCDGCFMLIDHVKEENNP